MHPGASIVALLYADSSHIASMTIPRAEAGWAPIVREGGAPLYRAIADALEADIRDGRLVPGDPLPTQRDLADELGINFTTVTRAYAEARRRGLITARVGRGTFVAAPAPAPAPAPAVATNTGDLELSVNAPPVPSWLPDTLRATIERVAADPQVIDDVLTYRLRHGGIDSRNAGVTWFRWRGLAPTVEQVVVTAGAQQALSQLLITHARPGDTVLVEALGYPGLQGAAAAVGVKLVGVEIDEQGVRPDALEEAHRRHAPRALFCVPNLQNPTAAVMSLARREQIVEVARRCQLRLVEDDICGPLLVDPPPPLATLAPELVTYVGSLSKCVAPGLRVAFVLVPTPNDAARLQAAVRASSLMLSPLSLAVATSWIADGTAFRVVHDISAEAAKRGAIARELFGDDELTVPPGALHAWLRLAPSWTVAAFVAQAQQQGIRVTPGDWYAIAPMDPGTTRPDGVRLTLGGERDRPRLERALHTLATIRAQTPGLRIATL